MSRHLGWRLVAVVRLVGAVVYMAAARPAGEWGMTTRLYDPATTDPVVRGILIVIRTELADRWRLHHNSRAHLPCRIVRQCGWASSAGDQTLVLLQLKGHLEDCLHNGARLITSRQQPPAEPQP